MRFLVFLLFFPVFFSPTLQAIELPARFPDLKLVESDFEKIFKAGGIADAQIRLTWKEAAKNRVSFSCGQSYDFKVESRPEEAAGTAYFALRKIGFLFPHPRWQVSPDPQKLKRACGKSWSWNPLLRYRGFHLHTQHAGEWTDGFFMDHPAIADETLWWLARNQQNLVQLQTLRLPDAELQAKLGPRIELAHRLGISFGMSFSFAMIQQKNYYLIPFWRALTGIGDGPALAAKLRQLIRDFDFDYVTSELGSTEFTPVSEQGTLKWMKIAGEELKLAGRGFFIKIHVSSNQNSEKYGNFNFLPRLAGPIVGAQAHTVFFYGLNDPETPMYGRRNFRDMKEFMLREKNKREVWYFPETSYYIAMDIDIPLLLTDYLNARADDMRFLKDNGFNGQVNFSTGQELGYWLFDWTVALLNDAELGQDPLAGLKLLGEDPAVWKPILAWQNNFIKKHQLIQALSSANFMDDFYPLAPKTHERLLLRETKDFILSGQTLWLQKALDEMPPLAGVKNEELRLLLEVTGLRVEHALRLREAIPDRKKLEEAVTVRKKALEKMALIRAKYNRYPESFIFEEKENPTSYPRGYGWSAANLHFWEREEQILRYHQTYNPFFMNIYNPLRILF